MGDKGGSPRNHDQHEDRPEPEPDDIRKAREAVAHVRDAHAELMRAGGAIYMAVGPGRRPSGRKLAKTYHTALRRFSDCLGDAVTLLGKPMYYASLSRWRAADAEDVVGRVWETFAEEAIHRPLDFQKTLAVIHDHVNPIGYMALRARRESPIASSVAKKPRTRVRAVSLPPDPVLPEPEPHEDATEEHYPGWAPMSVVTTMLDVGADDVRGTENANRYRGRLRRCIVFVCKQCLDVESVALEDLFGIEGATVRSYVLRFGNTLRKRFR